MMVGLLISIVVISFFQLVAADFSLISHNLYGGTPSNNSFTSPRVLVSSSAEYHLVFTSANTSTNPSFHIIHVDPANEFNLLNEVIYPDSATALDAAQDSTGNIIIVGATWGSDFDGQLTNGEQDAFVAKFNMTSFPWTESFGTIHNDEAAGIVVDSSGDVFIAGSWDDHSSSYAAKYSGSRSVEIFHIFFVRS